MNSRLLPGAQGLTPLRRRTSPATSLRAQRSRRVDLRRIRFLPPSDANDELFFVEQDRTVLADNTFSLKGARYEAPRDLRSRKVQVRFDRRRTGRVVVFFKGERQGDARPVDFVANDRPRRATTPESSS